MTSEAAVCRAQAQIYCALRCEPIGARAALPFDPIDRNDVRAWARRKLAVSRTARYQGTHAFVARALYWDAMTAADKARRRTRRRDGTIQPVCGLEFLEELADKPPWWSGWPEALDWVSSLAAAAARCVVDAAPGARGRKAEALLSCLGRTVAAIKSAFMPQIGDAYIAALVENDDFVALPLNEARRSAFRAAVTSLTSTGNLRRDLAAAGIPWAGAEQWDEFSEAVEQVERERRTDLLRDTTSGAFRESEQER